jgi:tetratricopeptide (TPR) repeat protein
MAVSVFLSTVSGEFRSYRDLLVHDLTRHNVAVKVQEDFKDLGGDTLDKLDTYIAHCDAVVHLVGDMCGALADETQQQALLAKHSDLAQRLPPLGEALKSRVCLPYTQWEAWLALYHGKPLMIAQAAADAPRGPHFEPNEGSRAAQAEHLERLEHYHRYSCEFENPDDLAKQIAYSAILDLLVADYAEKAARDRAVAEGFIREMAKRVAGDKALDLDGMKRAVRNAIEIYEKEIAGRPVETNLDDIVGRALARAKEQIDRGGSALARATLDRAAKELEREETERRERFVAGVTVLRTRERNYALASYDGDAAARAIMALAQAIHAMNPARITAFLSSEAQSLYDYGRDRGSNVHLVAAIDLRREFLRRARQGDQHGAALNDLGVALVTLGERETGIEKLEEAVSVYRVALEERTRGRVPLAWATTQMNLGNALARLGERESGTLRLEEAVAAFQAALEEWTRERVPLDWAQAQMNLGNALMRLGERESGTAPLEEAVAAYRAALEEWTRERVPLRWATTQNNLGVALRMLGEREGGTARLEEAVAAYRVALEESTRERVPLQRAMRQMNLGHALQRLGERESGTARLEEAVVAYRAAIKESTRERVPLQWAMTQVNLGNALAALGERESGTARLVEAVAAYRTALLEITRERVPLDWAASFGNQGRAMMLIADRTNDSALAETAVTQIAAAYETLRDGGQEQWAAIFQAQLPNAQAIRDRRKGK